MPRRLRKFPVRIVGHAEVAPDQLLANPLNFRIHSQRQQAAMEGVLTELGWLEEVLVNQATGHMINGHMRVMLALRAGEPTVPVKYVDLTLDEEITAVLTFDPIAGMALADREILAMALGNAATEEAAIQDFLRLIATQQQVLGAVPAAFRHGTPAVTQDGLPVPVTPADMAAGAAAVQRQFTPHAPDSEEVMCPACFHLFRIGGHQG